MAAGGGVALMLFCSDIIIFALSKFRSHYVIYVLSQSVICTVHITLDR